MPTDDALYTAVVVGDNRGAALKKVSTTLQKAGFEVVTASNGRAALERCRERHQPVELAVIDTAATGTKMPEIEEEFHEIYPHIRMLFLADDNVDILNESDSPGHFRRVLRKPYRRSRLLGRVLELMQPRTMGA
jgi:DNA-binding NtrC family response regulator